MKFVLNNKNDLIKGLKTCAVLADVDLSTRYVISLVERMRSWDPPLSPNQSGIAFYNFDYPAPQIFTLIENKSAKIVYEAHKKFDAGIRSGFVSKAYKKPALVAKALQAQLSSLLIECDTAMRTAEGLLTYVPASNTITLHTITLMRQSSVLALFPFLLLHELTHVIEPCTVENFAQTLLTEKIRQREPTADELEVSSHCARFRFILLSLCFEAGFIRAALYNSILTNLADPTGTTLERYNVDPYEWEDPIVDAIIVDHESGQPQSNIPYLTTTRIEGATTLEEARAKFFARPNLSTAPTQTGVRFKGAIVPLNGDLNLLRSASTYALNSLFDLYTTPTPTTKIVFAAIGPSLIAVFDDTIQTLRFFYTSGQDDFFEVTLVEAFWVLDFFRT